MTPAYTDDTVTVWAGDCLDVMRTLPAASVDAVVTDPPYGLEFMGAKWDGADGFRRSLNPADVGRGRASRTSPEYRAGHLFQQWCEQWATECLRVLKPGGYLLAFGGTRTWHRLAVAVEDAGFEMRDSIAWLYGSGFPKSLSVHKATLAAIESRYGVTRCGCLDAGDGRTDRYELGREGRTADWGGGGGSPLSAAEAQVRNVPGDTSGGERVVRELREADSPQAAGHEAIGEAVLLSDVGRTAGPRFGAGTRFADPAG